MSKPREYKHKETKARDLKGIFINSTSQIPSNLFGSRKTPPTNPAQRYIRKELDKEKGITFSIYELQTVVQLANPSYETLSEGKEATQPSETIVEQSPHTLAREEEIEQTIHPELILNFLDNSPQEVVISQLESKVTEVQSRTPSLTHSNPLFELPGWDNNLELGNQLLSILDNMAEEEERIVDEEQEDEKTFRFPILDQAPNVSMKNINPSILPTFHGMSTEDLDTFLFEFDTLCRSYNYIDDAQKLKLFPATLKNVALRWFMGLGEYTIRSWDEMKKTFLKKYQHYCKSKDSKDDIFKMQ